MRARTAAALVFAGALVSGGALADEVPSIRLNQLGFSPEGVKRAILASDERSPLAWSVLDAAGESVLTGESLPFGRNAGSGEHVHSIDISALTREGEGYRLVVAGDESRPFAIASDLYRSLKHDALHYFYHNRAGVPIEERYVGDPQWARPAGHDPDTATCFDKEDQLGVEWTGCDYTLDASRGWYDAGDHGKYVVNGGVTVWTLLNYYEREKLKDGGGESAFADGRMSIPESGNGVNDLLDEVRWQMDFMLAMQAPEGTTLRLPVGEQRRDDPKFSDVDASGMVHHKLASERWTPLPTAPHEDGETRYLYPPSTAATLNLAAVAAQCARIWRNIDAAYAERCLDAGIGAFEAALRNPDIFAASAFDGSGGYGDGQVSDEFYWAAAELFITTGDARYEEVLRASPHFLAGPVSGEGATGDIAWPHVGALGTISLAILPNGLADAEIAKARASLVEAADAYLKDAAAEGYVIPYSTDRYPWGSNSSILNRALVLAYAHDFTGEAAYRNSVVDAIDYILGRNPLDQSYVSGHGARTMMNPHHRFWARQADPAYPETPPGALSGGPNNTSMIDPIAREMRGECLAQTCWSDHYEAYALNEVAINWNAPLVWVAAFLDE